MSRRSRKSRESANAPYRSGFEKEMAEFLASKKIVFGYETRKIKYASPVRGGVCRSCGGKAVARNRTYVADFCMGEIVVETKGKLTSTERTKFIAIKQSNPTLDIRLVFQRDNRIRRNSKTYYSDWAVANGFEYCIGTKLPARWVRDLKNAVKLAKVADEKA